MPCNVIILLVKACRVSKILIQFRWLVRLFLPYCVLSIWQDEIWQFNRRANPIKEPTMVGVGHFLALKKNTLII